MKETKFNIRAIPDQISSTARNTRKSPQYGHPAHVEVASGTGPCRQCLQTFDVGKENRILFTYNPFEGHRFVSVAGSHLRARNSVRHLFATEQVPGQPSFAAAGVRGL
jgi:hypothetical protein